MAVKWTEDQQRVIDSRSRNLLVSAAAGSGKTAVLVERIVAMVTDGQDPVDLDELLVMTFTNAAAAEMRERIGKAIAKKQEEDPENERLRLQAALVPHAQIQTIDSFCLSLIRNHYASLEIDPSFRVGDEGELMLLRADVMAELLEEKYASGGERFEQFVETYGSGKTDMGIESVIEQVYHFSVSHPWPQEWLNQCRKEFAREGAEEFGKSPWMQFLLADVRRQMEEFGEQLDEVLDICQEPDGPEPYLPTIREDREMIRRIGASCDFSELQERLINAGFGKLTPIRKKDIDKAKKEFASSIRDRVKKAVNKCRDQYCSQSEEEIREAILGCAPVVEELISLTEEFAGRYKQAKKDRNLVDFGDLEHYALEVLYQEGRFSAVADELSKKYREILVDEYQDSNYVQEELLRALSGERFGRPDIFMVGDVKQSIYRFRQARPEIFLEKYHQYSVEEGKKQKIELQKNFRSRSQVLESINQVFYQIMRRSLGGIRYTKETALYPGAVFAPVASSLGADVRGMNGTDAASGTGEEIGVLGDDVYKTELFLVDTGTKELSRLDEEARDFTSREIEVKLAVREIRRLTDPKTGIMIWDKEKNTYRRARYGDIVILLRSLSGWAEVFVNGLMNEGIPAYAQSQAGYFDTTEVETTLSLLAVIDNPIQDIPLAAVMKSPIVGMTDEELAWMMAGYKKRAKKRQDRGIYGAWKLWLEKAEKTGENFLGEKKEIEESICRKVLQLRRLLETFRYQSGLLPMHQLLEVIYRETGYYAYVSAMPAGETRQANLDLLIEKAAAYEQTSYQGLFHFIRYVERLKKVETDFGEAAVAGAEDRTVRIMSIHKSKGLEFPVVILAGMGKKFNKRDVYGRLLIDMDFGVGADYLDLDLRLKSVTLKKQVLKRRMDLEGLGEELRVLYVAMTRAKEKLIMTATDPYLANKLEKYGIEMDDQGELLRFTGYTGRRAKPRTGENKAVPFTLLMGAASYLDWIFMALPKTQGTILCHQAAAASFIGTEVLRQMEKKTSREMLLNQPEGVIYHRDYHQALEDAMNYQYPFAADTELYAMMSVSELKRRSQEEESGRAAELFSGEAAEKILAETEGMQESKEIPETEEFKETKETQEKTLTAEEEKKKEKRRFGRGALRGTAYHRALELLNGWECETVQDVEKQLNLYMEKGRISREARKLVNAHSIWKFFQSDLGKRLSQAGKEGRLFKEQQFMIGVPARQMGLAESEELVLIQGMIDAYAEEEDGLLLVDYKTDYVENKEELLERYQVQMKYYIQALTQVTGKPVKEAVIYSLRLQEAICCGEVVKYEQERKV